MNEDVGILAPRGRDATVISQVLHRAGITSRVLPNLDALTAALGGHAAVIAAEEALAAPAIAVVLAWVDAQPTWSDLGFIVLTSKHVAPRPPAHAAAMARLGNLMLLERPLNAESLLSATRAALRGHRRQIAMRDLAETLETRVAQRTHDLTESEERLRATFESFPESLYVVQVTADGRFVMERHNPTAERRTGRSSAEIAGKPLDSILPPGHAATLTERFAECVAAGASIEFTIEGISTTGPATFETTLTPMRDATGRINRLLGVSRDMTERNRLEARLRAAQKLEAVGQLTGGVAHDFNNLLQVVISGLTLMDRVSDPARRSALLESVRRAAHRGGELTKRLLTVARRQALRPEPTLLGAWLADGAGELLARTLRGDIRTVIQVPNTLPPVNVDPAELELALLNLAVNSRDAMPGGGTLTVSAELATLPPGSDAEGLSGIFVRLSVTDTGTGMPPEVQAKVFEPFFTTKDIGKGTGLGLAQVYGFARQSGGGVRLRSRPGEGTTVSLLLPLAEGEAASPATEETVQDGAPAQSAAVLVCEDDDDVAALVLDMLTQLGHEPTRVSTAAAALGALADGRSIDLLFTDVMMPGGMDGLALAREAGRRRPGLPVLLTTGYTGGGPAAEPIGVPVLRKPYRIEQLAQAVQRALAA